MSTDEFKHWKYYVHIPSFARLQLIGSTRYVRAPVFIWKRRQEAGARLDTTIPRLNIESDSLENHN